MRLVSRILVISISSKKSNPKYTSDTFLYNMINYCDLIEISMTIYIIHLERIQINSKTYMRTALFIVTIYIYTYTIL